MLRINDSDIIKIIPTLYDGELSARRRSKVVILSNSSNTGRPYYISCPIIHETIIKYRSANGSKLISHPVYRSFYNVYHKGKVDFIMAGRDIDDIISNEPSLYRFDTNAHLRVICRNIDNNGYSYRDYTSSSRVDIEWDKPNINGSLSKWLSENDSGMNAYIENNTLKDISILGDDFMMIYNEIISKNREAKIKKLIYNLPK